MKQVHLSRITVVIVLLLFTLTSSCRELTIVERSYQRVHINDFSAPLRTLLPAVDYYPSSITLRVKGTISQPVVLAVDQLIPGRGRYPVRRDTLAAGTYAENYFISGDYYSKEETELIVTGTAGTTGSLTIEWYR